MEARVVEISVDQIKPNKNQPRNIFDDSKLIELADSIREHGIIQPIVVRMAGYNRYEIVAGERRFRAAKIVGMTKVPVIVQNYNEQQSAEIAIIENIQREDLTPIEEAISYQKLMELYDCTQEQLAQKLGKTQSTIANKLRLLQLPEKIITSINKKEITERHGRALLSAKDSPELDEYLKQIVDKGLNVKQTEALVRTGLPEKKPRNKPNSTKAVISQDMRIAINTIMQGVKMIEKSGMTVHVLQEEFDDEYQIVINLMKNK